MKVRTPADFCADRGKLLEPAVRTVISIAGVEEKKQGEFNVLGATEPELKCGPGVDNDGYFEANLPLGPYYLAADAKIRLLTYDEKAQRMGLAEPASVATLREVVKACKSGEQPSKPYTCGGNLFHATVDKNGVITDLTAVFQS
ncbi:hypothetical protein ABZ924_25670 [Streptomyces sp. NPDC046876]|uniref:hypothetical protein n=1 Tax=Streptomyces sp. NPDC046876 TaxID=3155616 RepID=UPI00340A0AC3